MALCSALLVSVNQPKRKERNLTDNNTDTLAVRLAEYIVRKLPGAFYYPCPGGYTVGYRSSTARITDPGGGLAIWNENGQEPVIGGWAVIVPLVDQWMKAGLLVTLAETGEQFAEAEEALEELRRERAHLVMTGDQLGLSGHRMSLSAGMTRGGVSHILKQRLRHPTAQQAG